MEGMTARSPALSDWSTPPSPLPAGRLAPFAPAKRKTCRCVGMHFYTESFILNGQVTEPLFASPHRRLRRFTHVLYLKRTLQTLRMLFSHHAEIFFTGAFCALDTAPTALGSFLEELSAMSLPL